MPLYALCYSFHPGQMRWNLVVEVCKSHQLTSVLYYLVEVLKTKQPVANPRRCRAMVKHSYCYAINVRVNIKMLIRHQCLYQKQHQYR